MIKVDSFSFQGVNGAYSEQAGKNIFPNATSIPCATFEDMFEHVRSGKSEAAMVPIENSLAGRVADTQRLIPDSNLKITYEYFHEVNHNLLGIKGQKSRSGVSIKAFEGGQMPLYQRLPKRGFNSRNSKKLNDQVNLGSIQKLIDTKKIAENSTINIDALRNVGLINKNAVSVKLLAKGALASKVKIEVSSASEKAKLAVEKLGGELKLIS